MEDGDDALLERCWKLKSDWTERWSIFYNSCFYRSVGCTSNHGHNSSTEQKWNSRVYLFISYIKQTGGEKNVSNGICTWFITWLRKPAWKTALQYGKLLPTLNWTGRTPSTGGQLTTRYRVKRKCNMFSMTKEDEGDEGVHRITDIALGQVFFPVITKKNRDVNTLKQVSTSWLVSFFL